MKIEEVSFYLTEAIKPQFDLNSDYLIAFQINRLSASKNSNQTRSDEQLVHCPLGGAEDLSKKAPTSEGG